MKVEILCKETVRPSKPTPTHLKTMTLPFVDQLAATFHIPILLVYTKTDKTPSLDVDGLKHSLSETLTQFYPLAGRCIDNSTLSCNDEGAAFSVANVTDCSLSSVVDSPNKISMLARLLPPRDYGTDDIIPIMLQFNVFPCGGIVLGCYMLHKLMDATSVGTFLKYWSALVSGRSKDLVQPNFEAALAALPPCDPAQLDSVVASGADEEVKELRPPTPVSLLTKTFLFSKSALTELRARAASDAVPHPTRFEALAGFIVEHALAAARACLGKDSLAYPAILGMALNMRPRMTPPLPQESMGNVITNVFARHEKQDGLPSFAEDIHVALSKAKDKLTRSHGGMGANNAFVTESLRVESSPWMKPGKYFVTSWSRLGLIETDFGFGIPTTIVPVTSVYQQYRNRMFFMDHMGPDDGDGIQVWLILEEEEMGILQSNPDFLAFASPT